MFDASIVPGIEAYLTEVTDPSEFPLAIEEFAATSWPTVETAGDVEVGDRAVWQNVGKLHSKSVDMTAQVIDKSANSVVQFLTIGDDFTVLVEGENGECAEAKIRWSLVDSETKEPVETDLTFAITDIDGGEGPSALSEGVGIDLNQLSGLELGQNTRLVFSVEDGDLIAKGTDTDSGEGTLREEAALRLTGKQAAGLDVVYKIENSSSPRGFIHDADGDFSFDGGSRLFVPLPIAVSPPDDVPGEEVPVPAPPAEKVIEMLSDMEQTEEALWPLSDTSEKKPIVLSQEDEELLMFESQENLFAQDIFQETVVDSPVAAAVSVGLVKATPPVNVDGVGPIAIEATRLNSVDYLLSFSSPEDADIAVSTEKSTDGLEGVSGSYLIVQHEVGEQ